MITPCMTEFDSTMYELVAAVVVALTRDDQARYYSA